MSAHVIASLAGVPIRRAGTWRVLLAVLVIPDTRVTRLAEVTGLSPRAVKSGLAELRALGLVRRVGGRCGRLVVVVASRPADTPGWFTPRQVRAIGACVTRMNRLTGRDAWEFLLPDATVTLLGLEPPLTIIQAYEALLSRATPGAGAARRAFVGAVIDLSISRSILGTRLT